jgi:hypothetical protein
MKNFLPRNAVRNFRRLGLLRIELNAAMPPLAASGRLPQAARQVDISPLKKDSIGLRSFIKKVSFEVDVRLT